MIRAPDWKPIRHDDGRWTVREGSLVGEGWTEVDAILDLVRQLKALERQPRAKRTKA